MWGIAIDAYLPYYKFKIKLRILNNIKITIDPLHVNIALLRGNKPLIFQDNFSKENGIALCF